MTSTDVGTVAWTQRTAGRLSSAEKRALAVPLLRAHSRNVVGRIAMFLRLDPGRRTFIPFERLAPPGSSLARAAEARARRMLPPVLLDHSFRTFLFARALAVVDGIDVDDEVLFAAAMLHDVGLVEPSGNADFTLTSARVARDVAERVGLSSAASTAVQTAITLHHSPGVSRADGPVAYLLSAGAAVDVVGLRAWDLPPSILAEVVERHPRGDFKRAFATAFAAEGSRVPDGRARFLLRYGAFGAAIRLAPFDA